MHHRRSRTSRREGKRLEDKAYRQAEKRAIERGVADTPPQDHWGYRSPLLPLGDVPCNGKRHGKKKAAKPKDRCPVNGTHEWYKEWVEKEDYYVLYTRCLKCANRGWGYVFGCSIHNTKHYYTIRVHLATCIHCWKTKKLKVLGGRWGSWRETRVRNRTLPKRPVKF
jgi:hypothetical protein